MTPDLTNSRPTRYFLECYRLPPIDIPGKLLPHSYSIPKYDYMALPTWVEPTVTEDSLRPATSE
jgi:hypothetical protein